MRVAAYCRVSTDDADQINSLENQMIFFDDYIKRNPEWEFVGIYSDEGVTGTSVEKRTGFGNMIVDARAGKIDLIVTKEVSRFARNTLDTLSYTRELRKINVGVCFINDNINTLDSDGEFRLAIMASVAQEESRKTSLRVKWGMHRQMEKGFVISPPVIGYDINDGVLTVNEEEARVVRRIFDLYVNERMGSGLIAKKLVSENTPLYKRIKTWSPTLIMRILKNEKYAGDLVQQKTTVTDYLNHKAVENKGDKLIFTDHHEAVVGRDLWDEAQRICASRNSAVVGHNRAKQRMESWCSGKIQCGSCGGNCVTKTKQAAYGTVRIYRCKHKMSASEKTPWCDNNTYIDERVLISCMQYAIKKNVPDPTSVLNEISMLAKRSLSDGMSENKLAMLETELTKNEQRRKKLLTLLLDDIITKDEYSYTLRESELEILRLKKEIQIIHREQINNSNTESKINMLVAAARKYMEQMEPTLYLYSEVLEKIIVYNDNHVDIFLTGTELPISVKYKRYGRGEQYTVMCEPC